MSLKIIIGADIVPTVSNFDLFENGNIDELIGDDLKNILESSDFIITNLEVPLVDTECPIEKCGPNLIAPSATIKGLKKINPYFYTLANNHIMDQGVNGLNSTIALLEENKIDFAGAGKDLKVANRMYLKVINGVTIGIYCCAEHEFSIATDSMPGANPYDPLNSFEDVEKLKKNADYVIVLFHGGKEHYRYPTPNLQKIFKKFSEKGANLVIAQHTHCVGCSEEFNSSTLVYGQGNFLFDNLDNEFWNSSILIRVIIDEDSKSTIDYLPLVKNGNKVRLAQGKEAEEIMRGFYERTCEIKNPNIIEMRFSKFAKDLKKDYLYAATGKICKNPIIRLLNKLTSYKILYNLYDKKSTLIMKNFIECESHREVMLEGLNSILQEDEK